MRKYRTYAQALDCSSPQDTALVCYDVHAAASADAHLQKTPCNRHSAWQLYKSTAALTAGNKQHTADWAASDMQVRTPHAPGSQASMYSLPNACHANGLPGKEICAEGPGSQHVQQP